MLLHLGSVLAVLLGEGVLLGGLDPVDVELARLGVESLLLRGVESPLERLLPRRAHGGLPGGRVPRASVAFVELVDLLETESFDLVDEEVGVTVRQDGVSFAP